MRQNPLTVAIVADDLTGALDTAAPFATQGFNTWLAWPFDTVDHRVDAGASVLALTTASRTLPPDAAAHRVQAAMRALAPLRPEIFFKKIDSMLRGNVGDEIVAAMMATDRRHAIIAPAVPGQNRTMRGGTVYVNGRPLAASDYGSEIVAEIPPTAYLPDLLQKTGGLQIHMVSSGQPPALAAGPGQHAYVADAETEDDLDKLAQFIVRHSPDVLPIGASGLGRALAGALGKGASVPKPKVGSGMLLFAVGSRQDASGVQVDALRAAGAGEIVVPVGPDADVDTLVRHLSRQWETPILVVRPESATAADASAGDIAARLGSVAASAVRKLRPAGIVMAGGDTAAACLEALEAECLHVVGELHDGIAFGTVFFASETMPFFTKSGSFGSQDTWTSLVALLRRPTS